MKIIKPSVEILTKLDGISILKGIEEAGRVCYKSEDKITEDSYIKFIEMLLNRNHLAMIEFGDMTAKFICDRGVTHEIVRHRLFSFAQESTRYCNYSKDKHGNELTFIEPCFWQIPFDEINHKLWPNRKIFLLALQQAEFNYLELIKLGATPQEARSILPNSLKTEIVIKGNLREWLHFFSLRTAPTAHPQMQEVAKLALEQFKKYVPIIFEEI